jgi:agmatinase
MIHENFAPAPDSGLFGYNLSLSQTNKVLLPVAWEPTTSYGAGTSLGPESIIKASHQLDFASWRNDEQEQLVFVDQELFSLKEKSKILRAKVQKVRESVWQGQPEQSLIDEVNIRCQEVMDLVYLRAKKFLGENKQVCVLGGDHSSPFGLIKALSEREEAFTILHVDAHMDLRDSYEGFLFSHASIMNNVLNQCKNVNLVQVGIRDFCLQEKKFGEKNNVKTFYSEELFEAKASGVRYADIVDQILSHVGAKVYVSFDIDGLSPLFCQSTGTPVPGGLNFEEAKYLLKKLKTRSQVIGFDLCEVVPSIPPSEWDQNVGARLLWLLLQLFN